MLSSTFNGLVYSLVNRPYILQAFSMITNYLRTSIRSLLRNRFSALINLLGLATGLCCVIYILLFAYDEYGYDRFHENADHRDHGRYSTPKPLQCSHCDQFGNHTSFCPGFHIQPLWKFRIPLLFITGPPCLMNEIGN